MGSPGWVAPEAEFGMDALWRQFFGSLVCAVLVLHWQLGIDRLTWDTNGLVTFAVILAICWLITWRAWPAVEITWDVFTSPEAKRAYRLTWPHVLGALGFSLGLALLSTLPLLLAGRSSDVDTGALARGALPFTLVFYITWPAIVVRWQRSRTRAP